MATTEEKEFTSTGREVTLIDRVFDTMVRGVVVITTREGERVNGMSACWVNRSADQPFLIAASIWKENLTYDMVRKSGVFAVHMLRSDQVQLARHFGKQSGRNIEKFASVPYRTGKTGAPILKDCLAYLDCRVVGSADSGDHTVFIGEVQDAEIVSRGEALSFRRIDYADPISPAPQVQPQKLFKITVKDIQGTGKCNFGFKKGDVILHPDTSPPRTIPNFCAWAYHEIHPVLFTLKFGGSFPWETEKNVGVACCSDSKNPVVFRIELIEKV
ncbi:MAG TPA: TIGR04076 family protein [Thermodesulfobacteriota bacterium]|nr:TIGR04076 family protein [Thermodesulfobacteriota bacterium]